MYNWLTIGIYPNRHCLATIFVEHQEQGNFFFFTQLLELVILFVSGCRVIKIYIIYFESNSYGFVLSFYAKLLQSCWKKHGYEFNFDISTQYILLIHVCKWWLYTHAHTQRYINFKSWSSKRSLITSFFFISIHIFQQIFWKS